MQSRPALPRAQEAALASVAVALIKRTLSPQEDATWIEHPVPPQIVGQHIAVSPRTSGK